MMSKKIFRGILRVADYTTGVPIGATSSGSRTWAQISIGHEASRRPVEQGWPLLGLACHTVTLREHAPSRNRDHESKWTPCRRASHVEVHGASLTLCQALLNGRCEPVKHLFLLWKGQKQ